MSNLFQNYYQLCELRMIPIRSCDPFEVNPYNIPDLLSIKCDKTAYEYFLKVERDEEYEVACVGLVNLLMFSPGFMRLYADHLEYHEGNLALAKQYRNSADHIDGMGLLLRPITAELHKLKEEQRGA